jgi:hypothetical protein
MNRTLTVHLLQIACAGAAVCLSMPAPARGVDCPAPPTALQQRLLAKADEGTDALRRFIYIRRAILQLDVLETAQWAEAWHAADAECDRSAMLDVPGVSVFHTD